MTGVTRRFFVNGNTAHGFKSLLDSSLQEVKQLFIIKEGPLAARSQIIRAIAEELSGQNYETWLLHSPSNNDALDGVIVPALSLGVIDGSQRQFKESQLPEAKIHDMDLSAALNLSALQVNQERINELHNQVNEAYERAYAGFAEALRIHDEWEALYISNMDFQAADELTDHYMKQLYGEQKLNKSSRIDHRFLGAATPQGAVDYVPDLTNGLKRYLIKGRAGSGKSTMLKKLFAAATQRGFDVEVYHCGFDSHSLDMIIVRELGFAIFDSTAPHEYFPELPEDEVIDMYITCIKAGTDEAHAQAISGIQSRYKAQMKQSTEQLALAKSLQDEIEQFTVEAVDPNQLEQIADRVSQSIQSILSKAL